jgi:hypothetical protein
MKKEMAQYRHTYMRFSSQHVHPHFSSIDLLQVYDLHGPVECMVQDEPLGFLKVILGADKVAVIVVDVVDNYRVAFDQPATEVVVLQPHAVVVK